MVFTLLKINIIYSAHFLPIIVILTDIICERCTDTDL